MNISRTITFIVYRNCIRSTQSISWSYESHFIRWLTFFVWVTLYCNYTISFNAKLIGRVYFQYKIGLMLQDSDLKKLINLQGNYFFKIGICEIYKAFLCAFDYWLGGWRILVRLLVRSLCTQVNFTLCIVSIKTNYREWDIQRYIYVCKWIMKSPLPQTNNKTIIHA